MDAVVQLVRQSGANGISAVNNFNKEIFRTRGGRLGSGMGLLLEGLWGYHTNIQLSEKNIEIAWIVDHEYNDFAVIDSNSKWNPSTKNGEHFRVEIKSMNIGADESKAHFDEIKSNIGENDELVVLAWKWEPDGDRVWPKIVDWYMGNARAVAELRDELHIARGGSFVLAGNCPDGCKTNPCSHVGEPLNASGKRERVSGPEATRVSAKVSFASNFGGLVRMVKVRGADAKESLEKAKKVSADASFYMDFIQRLLNQGVETD